MSATRWVQDPGKPYMRRETVPDNETKQQEPIGDATARCGIWRFLVIIGGLIAIGFGYTFLNIQAAAVERAVVKDRMERMASDVSEIKQLLQDAVREDKR